jgi:hypothetical protein
MTLLLAAVNVVATPPPDLRAAIATEQLVVATRWLVGVGVATLVAAVVAAIAALRTYQLEAVPGVVIAEHPEGAAAALRHAGAYRVVREPPVGAGLHGGVPPPKLQPVREKGTTPLPHAYAEVRNIGRVAIADVQIDFSITTRDLDLTISIDTYCVVGSGSFGKRHCSSIVLYATHIVDRPKMPYSWRRVRGGIGAAAPIPWKSCLM